MSEIIVNTKFSSELIEQSLACDPLGLYDTGRRIIHLQELGVIKALQELGWSTPDQTKELQAENERLKEQYESTPERALKIVMKKYQLSFHGSVEAIAILQEPYKTIACCPHMGPCCGTFTLTAEDIETDG